MLVSWKWLQEYVTLNVSHAELTQRLMMAGLNHESTEAAGADFCIDLEITSNRPDCLGHIGVAREAAVLLGEKLKVPKPEPKTAGEAIEKSVKIQIDAPELCPRYSARLIRGVKIKPSPAWLVERLQTIGQPAINNVVDVSNYVLMECGQPLHAFDFRKLAAGQIIVRRAKNEEQFPAIDHKTYTLTSDMCVIADAERPVALAGVMGGAETEVTATTTDVLIESAQFAPLAVRGASRKLKLASDSSYRFERGTDPAGVDWASLRACELILQLAGGELAPGVIDLGPKVPAPQPIVLRLSQLKRILGIEIPAQEVERILAALGCGISETSAASLTALPPPWRRDLTREIDLVEEAARIHGYDKIPEDIGVPMAPSHKSDHDRVLQKVRHTMTAAGFDEALTTSVVSEAWSSAFSPWTHAAPLVCNQPMLKGADRLRRSIVPSLLESRRLNESLGCDSSQLFETARIYLPLENSLPHEQWSLAAVSGHDFLTLKGVVESVLARVNPTLRLEVVEYRHPMLVADHAAELRVAGQRFGYLGKLSPAGLKQFGLRREATIVEFDLGALVPLAVLTPHYQTQISFPAIARDLNLIVDEPLRWSQLAGTVQAAAGERLQGISYLDTYRDVEKDGAGKKRLLFSVQLRSAERTLTGEEADQIIQRIVDSCQTKFGAKLLG
ncbi:Phenylalanine--tRNA ligase beta subunit [Anatilimnocola aggregata]|uniref:Phenylalanine--tRNA ligase beta subunit n=1 Tax=Anatilimnocola aggregata TaxID=2528021 RepID=A0A517YJ99_9BACT|nr:phenylalanine--tRNA ligase subunit beta [Anatilimnocola aggregata]QDU30301.1 Phenylalanine--tRNA ligase beta subunit [Anatilimnocola aggregata]